MPREANLGGGHSQWRRPIFEKARAAAGIPARSGMTGMLDTSSGKRKPI